MLTPGAVTSGLSRSESGVGPPEEKYAITPVLLAAATEIAPAAVEGEPIDPGTTGSKALPAATTETTPAAAAAFSAWTTMSREGVISGSPYEKLITSIPSLTACSIAAATFGGLPSRPEPGGGIWPLR